MKRIVILIFLSITAFSLGWYYVPSDTKNKMLALVGAAANNDKEEIKNTFKDIVLPENPEKKREFLIKELKNNLIEIKTQITQPTKLSQKQKNAVINGKNAAPQKQSVKELISSSEKALEKLEESNNDKSATEKITERVIEIILPNKETNECIPKK